MMAFNQEEVQAKNEESLRTLGRAIALSQGQLALILVRCNYTSLQQRIMQQLQERSAIKLREIVLEPSTKFLDATIQAELQAGTPPAIIVSGLELVRDLDALLVATNQARDEFRQNFCFPIVLWVTDPVLQKLIRVAPDFNSWAAVPIEFELTTEELINFIQITADEVFAKVLDAGAGRFLDNTALNLEIGSSRRAELESAGKDLPSRGVNLQPELEASLEFVLGRDPNISMENSRQHYEQSLALWQSKGEHTALPNYLERKGCLLYCLGLWWRTYAVRYRAKYNQACGQAKDYFQQCIEVFEQANRPDLVAKFINALEEVLQRLQQWDELETVAQTALTLHRTYPDLLRLARTYGFLAEVALAKSAWTEAKHLTKKALSILASVQPTAATLVSSEIRANLDWEKSYHQGWYLFSLARSLSSLGETQAAIKTLETALAETEPHYDPELYIRILQELRNGYFKQRQYLTAFQVKQEQRSIEQWFGFRAFIGASRLQPKQQVTNPAIALSYQPRTVAQEIAASVRQQDVNCLVERMSRDDCKLTVIHGQSGVGKSSILQAGLIPALKQKTIGTRKVLPVLQQVYTDWVRELCQRLTKALEAVSSISKTTIFDSTTAILEKLQQNAANNLLTVLIFDQFEEFFFACKDQSEKRRFYEFLRDCLELPYVKVILSLREDYLHELLEFTRLNNLEVINNNILDKNILCYLGNFFQKDAKLIIQSFVENEEIHCFLEPALIDKLVQDLAGELGEVRPIELQVVGAQLEAEKITTLAQYQRHGPKLKLVEQFLKEVIKDCGFENERVAQLALYLLTDENGTRPAKTYAELAADLDSEAEKLHLVLKILVSAGFVFQLPQYPAVRYQLVHDYLVPFIRQQTDIELREEIKRTKEQLKQSLHRAEMAEIDMMNLWSQALFLSDDHLGALLASVKAARKAVRQLDGTKAESDIKIRIERGLRQIVQEVQECNRFEGHSSNVFSVSFSPDGQMLASASADKTVKLWSLDGKELQTFQGHTDWVWGVSFSPDGQMLASASDDTTIKLWSLNGEELRTFQGHRNRVWGVNFSPDGQMLASASEDKTVKLWNLKGKQLRTFQGHRGWVRSVCFSLDGQMLASGSEDGTVRLWNLRGKQLQTFEGHSGWVLSVSFSPDGQRLASASADNTVKLWNLDGTEVRTFKGHRRWVRSVCFSSDGQMLASASEDKTVKLWNLKGTDLPILHGHSGWVLSVSFSPDGQLLASASADKTVKLWSIDGKTLRICQGHSDRVKSVIFSPDGKMLASASDDKTVKLWSIDGKTLRTFYGHSSRVRSVSFSPDGKMLASASEDGTLKLWNLDGKELQTFSGHGDWIRSVCFSPDGKVLASASDDKTVKLWNLDGEELRTLQGHRGWVRSVCFSPDGKMLASASEDNTVKLWNLYGKELRTFQEHGDWVLSVRFSPNGQMLASGSADNTVKLWNLDGEELRTFKGHSGWVRSVSFSLDGKILASASVDNTVRLWKLEGIEYLNLDALLVRGCDWLHDYLNTNPNVSQSDRHLCNGINV